MTSTNQTTLRRQDNNSARNKLTLSAFYSQATLDVSASARIEMRSIGVDLSANFVSRRGKVPGAVATGRRRRTRSLPLPVPYRRPRHFPVHVVTNLGDQL